MHNTHPSNIVTVWRQCILVVVMANSVCVFVKLPHRTFATSHQRVLSGAARGAHSRQQKCENPFNKLFAWVFRGAQHNTEETKKPPHRTSHCNITQKHASSRVAYISPHQQNMCVCSHLNWRGTWRVHSGATNQKYMLGTKRITHAITLAACFGCGFFFLGLAVRLRVWKIRPILHVDDNWLSATRTESAVFNRVRCGAGGVRHVSIYAFERQFRCVCVCVFVCNLVRSIAGIMRLTVKGNGLWAASDLFHVHFFVCVHILCAFAYIYIVVSLIWKMLINNSIYKRN